MQNAQKALFLKIPGEIGSLLEKIKAVRSKNFEPTTNTQIVIDAIKKYHENITSKN
mgnify:CR=1 FL=1